MQTIAANDKSRYKPVEVKAVQWAKVYKEIQQHGHEGLSIYRLAEIFRLAKDSPELAKTLELLLEQGRVRISLGLSNGMPCRFVQALKPELLDDF
jgi:hypothetical protein